MLGPGYQNSGLVFSDYDGTPWDPDKFTAAYRRLAKRIKLKTLRFHDLRHTHATYLLQAGVHVKVVSEQSRPRLREITLDTYSQVMPNMQAEAAEKIDAAFENKSA